MATTLLLEGDDLETLLARARAEGGPDARIVRAEKIRHGGMLGFFARERFEVALEVPDPAPGAHPAVDPGTTSGGTGTRGPAMTHAGEHPPGPAFERLTRRLVAAAEDPRVAAAEGLLDLADRADAVERASAERASGSPQVPEALDLAVRRLLDQRAPGAVGTTASPVRPSTTSPEFTALLDGLRTTTSARSSVTTAPGSAQAAVPAGLPAAYRAAAVPLATSPPVSAIPAQPGPPAIERHTLGRHRADAVSPTIRDRREDSRLIADRRALRALGVPSAWTRQLRPGDRFGAVLRMLDRMPEVDIDPATRAVAVVGRATSVLLEAHRTALDLATGPAPRPVVHVPAAAGAERAAALAEARLLGDVVVAVEADGGEMQVQAAVEALQTVGAGAVIAVVSAVDVLERSQAYLDALGQVDALAVEGAGASAEPAAVLQLGLPIVRLDGIPVDRYTWTAVLCAQLGPADGRVGGAR
ncbi:MAG TPA: hypothetical protein VMT69_13350 [Kineosporiaceae bacterium]|nr:hypothetical protein [Kineosporiaceae bacterium]